MTGESLTGESWTGLLDGTEDSTELLEGRELARLDGRVQTEDLLDCREKEIVGRRNGSMCYLTEKTSGDIRCAARQGEKEVDKKFLILFINNNEPFEEHVSATTAMLTCGKQYCY